MSTQTAQTDLFERIDYRRENFRSFVSGPGCRHLITYSLDRLLMTSDIEISEIVSDEKNQSKFVDQLLHRQDEVIEQLDELNDKIKQILHLYNANRESDQTDSDQPAAA